MRSSLLIVSAVMFFSALPVYSDESRVNDGTTQEKFRELISFDDKLSIRVFSNPSTFMSFSAGDGDSKIVYKSNPKGAYGLGLSYEGYGLSTTLLKNSKCNENERKYGKSQYYDITLSKYGKNIGGDFFFRKYKGMYIEKYPDCYDLEGRVRKNVRLPFIGFYLSYVFFEEFSFNEIMKQSERRIGFSWSPSAGLYYDYFKISSGGGLIPAVRQAEFPDFYRLNSTYYNGGGIMGGWGAKYCFPFKVYISAALFAGIGFGNLKMNGESSASSGARNMKLVMKVSLGFNGDTFGCGLILTSERSSYYSDNSEAYLSPFANYGEFFLLFRI